MTIRIPKDWKKNTIQATPVSLESLRLSLEPGMIVKFGGCRDGTGLREIIELNGDSVVGRKLVLRTLYKKRGPEDRYGRVSGFEIEKTSYMSENHISKIQMWYDAQLDQFVKLKVL
jgi:hypothetical protein